MKTQDENIALLLAGELDEAGQQTLVMQLAADPEAMKKLGGHVTTDALLGTVLEDEFSAGRRRAKLTDALCQADQDDFLSGVQGKIRRRTWRNRLLASAAVLLFGAMILMINRSPDGAMVASVTRLETLNWGTGTPVAAGENLTAGSHLRFDSGLVELEMGGRGRMIVEGPADLELTNPMRSILHRGRILMRVTEAGHGYRLETSKGSVIDLGTEFGVSVDGDQGVETHVLEGEVEAIPDGGAKVLLKKNDALRFSGAGGERFKADGGSFYTDLPPKRSQDQKFVHWPLEAGNGMRDTAAVRGFETTDCDMVLQKMDQGEIPSQTNGVFGEALSFDGKGSFAESNFPGIGGKEPRTVSFWVKVPEDFNKREGYGIISWGRFEGNNFGQAWQISINPVSDDGPLGRLRVGTHGGQIVGATDLRDGKWHHVAVVLYQSSNADIGRHVLIYLDGGLEPISRRALQEVNTRIKAVDHGVWLGRNLSYIRSDPAHQGGGFFRGDLDEVYIFNSALSHDEIRSLMQSNEVPR